ncbi:MAG: NAD(+)/NADH kinase [Neisseria sp.]|nr:NAD(+)/NADH kinase [Neisseria sp.]
MSAPARVGIIANPVSARDIRRVIAHAAGLPLGERANMLLRIVNALAACGVDEVWLMPEGEGLRAHFERMLPAVLAESAYPLPKIVWLKMPVSGRTADSTRAAEIMHEAGLAAIMVLGGDGTHRAVVKGCGNTPIAGISTGTNNAFPPMREATVTAFAVGRYAVGNIPADIALCGNKCLHVRRFAADGRLLQQDLALIDAAILNERLLGAKAIGDADTLRTIVVTQASVEAVGLSAIAAMLQPLSRHEAGGLVIELIPPVGKHAAAESPWQLQAVLAPGTVSSVRIAACTRLLSGALYSLSGQNGLVALDGEREIAFRADERIEISLQENAFYTIDVAAVLHHAAYKAQQHCVKH